MKIFDDPSHTKVLVIGVTGMLGNAAFRLFYESSGYQVFGTARALPAQHKFSDEMKKQVFLGVDIESMDAFTDILLQVRPKVVINCVGVVKQLQAADDVLQSVPINSVLPHRLAKLCALIDARLVHMSTDCVFSGRTGMYEEGDFADADDIYGRSKLLGEVHCENAVTLRTSIIGHELSGSRSLINWFLSQTGSIKGYKKAFFSGLPTVEIARVIRDYVIPNTSMSGLYHLSADPISKFDLLEIVASVYSKEIIMVPDEVAEINRSLNSSKFRNETGYTPDSWQVLIQKMYDFH